MKYKAVFFDRDNTLLTADPALRMARRARLEAWGGRPFQLSGEESMELFDRAGYPKTGLKSVAEEERFWRRYWREVLLRQGITEQLDSRAEELHQMSWLKGYALFPETRQVLSWLRSRGYLMGVISDTSPSLALTLEAAGIGEYFSCAVCSDLVGVMKPEKAIYQAALSALGVQAEESIYVDDYAPEAEGARALGFTAFHLDRSQRGDGAWRIDSLLEIETFLQRAEEKN